MEKALAQGPGSGTGCPSSSPASGFPCRRSLPESLGSPWEGAASRARPGRGLGGGEAARAWGAGTSAKRGAARVILQVQEVSSQVLTHNNSEQGEECARGREGEAERESCGCRRPQAPAPGGRVAARGTAGGTRGARVGRCALAPPRPMVRGGHPGRRRVRGRAQRRSRCQATCCPPASLCLTPAYPHQRSPVETAAASAPRRPRAHSSRVQPSPGSPRRMAVLS